jgi:hypothetical protein
MIMMSVYKKKHLITRLLIFIFAVNSMGCNKLVEVSTPDNRIASQSVYASDATAIAVLTGLYTTLSKTNYIGSSATIPTISMWGGLSADEFTLWSNSSATIIQLAYYKNALSVSSNNTYGSEFWTNIYPYIYICNSAIEGLNASSGLTPAVKQQLLGEAKFMRAFFYFYLVNLYGSVPLVLTTDYTLNALLPCSSVSDVNQQIVSDLKDAQSLLVDGYIKGDALTLYPVSSAERVRPNKAAATALLAREYLYTQNFADAEAQASTIINNKLYFDTTSLNKVFLKNSVEAIWQLQPVTNGTITNTAEATTFILSFAPAGLSSSTHPVYLSNNLLNSFELGDQRKVNGNWVNVYSDATGTYYYPYKYKNVTTGTGITPTEYNMMLRLGEQYLIRAEARAQQNNLLGADSDLNIIRIRAGLLGINPSTRGAILTAIWHERQVELFTEMSQRWLDLKRTGTIDAVMSLATPTKGGTWNTIQQLYPLPASDLSQDSKLVQNPGY